MNRTSSPETSPVRAGARRSAGRSGGAAGRGRARRLGGLPGGGDAGRRAAARPLLWATLAVDAAVLWLLLLAGWHGVPALLLAEMVGWLLRLAWLSPALLAFIGRRLLQLIPIVLAVVAIGFLLIDLAPGDVFAEMSLNPDIRPADLERFRQNFGLDDPWYVQFLKYLWNALRGDFGFSQMFKTPVFALVGQRALNTLLLAVASLLLAWAFSVPAGVIAAARQYRWPDQTMSVLAFVGLSIPNFFLAFLLLYVVSTTGNWLPIGGMTSIDHNELGPFGQVADVGLHMVIPVVVLATAVTAGLFRIMRANMLYALGQQYTITARAKGLRESAVIYRHGLRNAVNPMISILGLQLGDLLSGAALVEFVTAWPGLGKLILQALLAQDLYLVVGSLLYGTVLLMLGNLVADILLAVVDPRVRMD